MITLQILTACTTLGVLSLFQKADITVPSSASSLQLCLPLSFSLHVNSPLPQVAFWYPGPFNGILHTSTIYKGGTENTEIFNITHYPKIKHVHIFYWRYSLLVHCFPREQLENMTLKFYKDTHKCLQYFTSTQISFQQRLQPLTGVEKNKTEQITKKKNPQNAKLPEHIEKGEQLWRIRVLLSSPDF